MSEKHFGESEKMKEESEQMIDQELAELLDQEIPEGEVMPEVSDAAVEKIKEKIEDATDKNPER